MRAYCILWPQIPILVHIQKYTYTLSVCVWFVLFCFLLLVCDFQPPLIFQPQQIYCIYTIHSSKIEQNPNKLMWVSVCARAFFSHVKSQPFWLFILARAHTLVQCTLYTHSNVWMCGFFSVIFPLLLYRVMGKYWLINFWKRKQIYETKGKSTIL